MKREHGTAASDTWNMRAAITAGSASEDEAMRRRESRTRSGNTARGLEKKAGQSLDPDETIDIVEVPVEEAIRDMGTGIYDNGIMMMAIGFFLRYAEQHPELGLRGRQ